MPVRTGTQPPRFLRERTGARRRTARDATDAALFPEGEMKLHHERDESPDGEPAGRTDQPVTDQAYQDAAGGQRDTDVRGTAVDVFRRATGTRSRAGTEAGRSPPRHAPNRRRGRRA